MARLNSEKTRVMEMGDPEYIIVYRQDEATARIDGEWQEYETVEMVQRKYARGEIDEEEMEERIEQAIPDPGTPVLSAGSACGALRLQHRIDNGWCPDEEDSGWFGVPVHRF